jgi:poly(3-hydroxybutyrate) depolymerase
VPDALFVYPQADGAWDTQGPRDLAFIDELVRALGEEQCFLSNRLFTVGVGDGGSLVNELACTRSAMVRAVAAVGGEGPRSLPCRAPVAAWQADASQEALEHWLRQNRCTGADAVGACLQGSGCFADYPVSYCEVGARESVPTFVSLQIATFFAPLRGVSVLE